MFSFQRGPNPEIERQKTWNLESILSEWERIAAQARAGSIPSIEPGTNHRDNLVSLLGCFAQLELAHNRKRSSREAFSQALPLLKKSGVSWQVSRNDFLWGELFSRYGFALSCQGEPWLGGFAASLIPRALWLAPVNETKSEPFSLLATKAWQNDIELSGDWIRDRERLAQNPLQSAICDYLLTSDPSPLFSRAAKASPEEIVELRLVALLSGNAPLLRRLSRFSSLAKVAKKLPVAALSHLHALEAAGEGTLVHPSDWLALGEICAKYLERENSRRRATLTLAYLSRLAIEKRQAGLGNFLFRSYSELGQHLDPYGITAGSDSGYIPHGFLGRGTALLNLTKELGLLFGRKRLEKLILPKARMQLSAFERQRLLELTSREMTRLKGPVMKLGQMVTYVGTDLSPAERSLFDCLWQDSSPVPYNTLYAQLSAEQKQKLIHIDSTPLGCGSVSQVHRALTIDGKEVALKVLLPGLPEVIQTDFQIVRTLLPVARWLVPGVPLEDFYREMEQGLSREIDFVAEADSLQKLKARFSRDPDIRIPDLCPELSNTRTIAMSLERGQSFSEFVRTASQSERDRAGQAIVRFVVSSVKERFFNSDPHPGNYIFNGNRVTFLDFGAAAAWDARTSEAWNGLILAFLHYDLDRFAHSMRLVNGISPHATKADMQTALDFFAKPQEGFWNTGKFSTLDPDISVRQLQGLVKAFGGNRMPIRLYPKFLFGMRVYLGHLHVVARLGARANWKELVQEIFPD